MIMRGNAVQCKICSICMPFFCTAVRILGAQHKWDQGRVSCDESQSNNFQKVLHCTNLCHRLNIINPLCAFTDHCSANWKMCSIVPDSAQRCPNCFEKKRFSKREEKAGKSTDNKCLSLFFFPLKGLLSDFLRPDRFSHTETVPERLHLAVFVCLLLPTSGVLLYCTLEPNVETLSASLPEVELSLFL